MPAWGYVHKQERARAEHKHHYILQRVDNSSIQIEFVQCKIKFQIHIGTVLYSTSDVSSIWEFTEITVIEQVLWFCSSVHVEDDIVPTVTDLRGPGRKVGGKTGNHEPCRARTGTVPNNGEVLMSTYTYCTIHYMYSTYIYSTCLHKNTYVAVHAPAVGAMCTLVQYIMEYKMYTVV